MRSVVVVSLVAALAPFAAHAEDKVLYGPPPAWVDPPTSSSPGMAPKNDDTPESPLRVLTSDSQSRFTAEGVTTYRLTRVKIETAEGLAAGAISEEWDPATGSLTVHRLQVIRDGRAIDVLKSQTFEILRRERSLEQSMLDGRLTAALQIADLRVGDIVELATTDVQREPVLAGRNGLLTAFSSEQTVGEVRVRAVWEGAKPIWRIGDGLPKATIEERADGGELRFVAQNLKGPTLPEGAPARYMLPGLVEVTQLKTWKDASAAFRPLYDKASTLTPNSPLRAEVERIRQAGKTPEARAALALQLVEDQIRYVAISMDAQGFIPAAADETWKRRFGDCKAKTALLLALLRELGIEADPVLVQTDGGDGLSVLLPLAAAFDHVLVRATIDGRAYWLDGTRTGDGALAQIHTPDLDWGLPLTAVGSDLVAIKPARLERPETQHTLKIDATKGFENDVPVELEVIARDEDAGAAARGYRSQPKAQLQRSIIDAYADDYPWVSFTDASWRYAPEDGKLVFTLKGVGSPDVRTVSGGKRFEIPGSAVYASSAKLRPSDQDATIPYETPGNAYERHVTVIRLPADTDKYELVGTSQYWKASGVQRTRWGRKYRDTIYVMSSLRSVDEEVSAERMAKEVAEARRFQATALAVYWPTTGKPLPKESLMRADGSPITILARNVYSDMEAEAGAKPLRPKIIEAISKVVKARDPQESLRILDASKGDFEGAEENFALARARVLLRLQRQDEAMAMLDKPTPASKVSSPSSLLAERASLENAVGRKDAALRSITEALKLDPKSVVILDSAINLKAEAGDFDGATALMRQRVRIAPDDPSSWAGLATLQGLQERWEDALRSYQDAEEAGSGVDSTARAEALAHLGRSDEAMKMVDAYLAAAPDDATILNNACWARATANLQLEKALAECQRAVSMGDVPGHRDSLAFVKLRLGRNAEAIADYDKILAGNPKMSPSLFGRGLAKIRIGQVSNGQADIEAARQISPAIDAQFRNYGLTPPAS